MYTKENIFKIQSFNNRNVIEIIKYIRALPGKNDKVAILKLAIETNQTFKSVLIATYDKFYVYGIKSLDSIPKFRPKRFNNGEAALGKFCNIFLMKQLATGSSGAEMKKMFSLALDKLTVEEIEVVKLILTRSLDAGFSVSSINKACPGLIPEFPVQKCQKFNEKTIQKINFPAIAQLKEDGLRCIVLVEDGTVQVRTGNAKTIYDHKQLEKDALILACNEDIVLDGELIFFNGDERLDRKTSNGLGNKAIKNTLKTEDANNIRFICWDIIPLADFKRSSSGIRYESRFSRLKQTIDKCSKIMLVENVEVQSLAQARQFYMSKLDEGMEGIILKNKNALWNSKRSSDLLKFKVENTADLKIMEVVEGAGKYSGMLGAFILQSECGMLEVSCGSGLTDSQREEYFSNNMVGKIVEVKYNELIQSKLNNKKMSLFLPIFVKVREDKNIANTVPELK